MMKKCHNEGVIMQNLKRIFIILCAIPMTTSLLWAQDIKDVYKSLRKVDIQFQSGINYDSFKTAYIDAKLEADMYFKSDESSKFTSSNEHIKRTILIYDTILNLWDNGKLPPIDEPCLRMYAFVVQTNLTEREFADTEKLFPILDEYPLEKGEIDRKYTDMCKNIPTFSSIKRQSVINVLIKEASKELDETYASFLKKTKNKK